MKIEIHNHHHNDHKTIDRVIDYLQLINSKLNKIMTKQEHIDAAIATLTTSAADISQDLNFLKEQIANGTVTDESVNKLTELADAFSTIAGQTDSSTPPSGPSDPTEGEV